MLIVVWFCVYVIEWKYVFAVYFDFCVLYEFVVKRRYIFLSSEGPIAISKFY